MDGGGADDKDKGLACKVEPWANKHLTPQSKGNTGKEIRHRGKGNENGNMSVEMLSSEVLLLRESATEQDSEIALGWQKKRGTYNMFNKCRQNNKPKESPEGGH